MKVSVYILASTRFDLSNAAMHVGLPCVLGFLGSKKMNCILLSVSDMIVLLTDVLAYLCDSLTVRIHMTVCSCCLKHFRPEK